MAAMAQAVNKVLSETGGLSNMFYIHPYLMYLLARICPYASRYRQMAFKTCFIRNSYLNFYHTGVTSIPHLMRWLCILCLNTVPSVIDNLAWGTSQQDVR